MPSYRVYRLKDHVREQFRWAPHLSGVTALKPRDYEEAFVIQATAHYAAWHQLRGTDRALLVGDVLESDAGDLRILKYIGFEQACWIVPEQQGRTSEPSSPPASGGANTGDTALG
jgi:hypothetical protein